MVNLTVSLAAIPAPLTRPILSGEVPVEGVDLRIEEAKSVNANSVKMLDLAFDVGEMSLATYTKAREQGVPLIALPLFTGRRFLHGAVNVATRAGIKRLTELRGKRVGLPQFWMTSSVWHRLILRQIDGVTQNEVNWVTCAGERMGALGYPNGVKVRLDTSGRSPRELLKAGEIDATMEPGAGPPAEPDDAIAPAFPDLKAAQRGYYEQTHLFPIMHMIVMKQALAEREPSVVGAFCRAFQAAKEIGGARALESGRGLPLAGATVEEVQALLGEDPWPYGIRANIGVLETFLKDARDQGLTDRVMAVDELFASNLPDEFR